MEAVFWLGIMVLKQISRSRFQAVKNLSAHPTYYVLGCFVNYFGDFWVYLEINSFSQRIEIENLEDLMLFQIRV